MCERHQADPGPAPAALASRRRRLWDLGAACHCPLIGVGLPLGALRKLVAKACGAGAALDDYELHVGAVTECGGRNRLSDALQKELERRYAAVILLFRRAKCGEQVERLWRAAVAEGNVSGAFWAGLTHPRCTAELEERMCRDLHMIQHQAGACVRADLNRFNALQEESAGQKRELERLRQRGATLLAQKCADFERHELLLARARAEAVGKDSVIDSLRAELAQLRASVPELESRAQLAERLSQMDQRERDFKHQIAELKQALSKQAPPSASKPPPAAVAAQAAAQAAGSMAAPGGAIGATEMPLHFVERRVLCVGGRSGNIATYRSLIERVGARFSHHDGGLEDSANLLDTSLDAADFVICQTGCISHNAYWRVKDHCKRTGKRCLFVENPSISSLARSLREASAPVAAEAPAS